MNCKLCNNKKDLRDSHIFPKFVFRWLSEKGGNYIRKPDNPNIRHQDGLKVKMLCHDCEQIFSKYENVFSRDVFYPHVNHYKTSLYCDVNTLKFSLSVLWRVLLTGFESHKTRSNSFIEKINLAEKEWREFLIDGTPLKDFKKVFIFFTTHGINYKVQPVERFLQYYARGVDGDIVFNENTCFIYAKLARVIIIGEIQNPENLQFTNTILSESFHLNTSNTTLNLLVKQYLINRVSDINIHLDNVSERQKEVAIKNTEKQIKNLEGEEIYKIIEAESSMKIDKNYLDF